MRIELDFFALLRDRGMLRHIHNEAGQRQHRERRQPHIDDEFDQRETAGIRSHMFFHPVKIWLSSVCLIWLFSCQVTVTVTSLLWGSSVPVSQLISPVVASRLTFRMVIYRVSCPSLPTVSSPDASCNGLI